MPSFNSNAPDVLGFEPRFTEGHGDSIHGSVAIAQRFKPGAQTLSKFHLMLSAVNGSKPGIGVEVLTSPDPQPQTNLEPVPASDVLTSGWEKENAATTNLFQSLVPRYDESTFIRNRTALGPWSSRLVLFRGGDTALTSAVRVLAVGIGAIARFFQWADSPNGRLDSVLRIGGVDYAYDSPWYLPNDYQWHAPYYGLSASWNENPATGLPWTIADVNKLITAAGTDAFGYRLQPVPAPYFGNQATAMSISEIALWVLTIPENRLSSLYRTSRPRDGWDVYDLPDFSTAANTYYWLNVFGFSREPGDYLWQENMRDDQGGAVIATSAAAATGEHRSLKAAHLGWGHAADGVMAQADCAVVPFLAETAAGAVIDGSNPYVRILRADLCAPYTTANGWTGQKVTPGVTKDYAAVVLTVGWGAWIEPDQPLEIIVNSAADGSGTTFATARLYPDRQDTWVKDRQMPFLLDAVVTGTLSVAKYVLCRSFASADRPWRLLYFDTRSDRIKSGSGTTVAKIEGVGLGGQTDGFVQGGTLRTRYDAAIALVAAPDPVTGFTATPVAAV